MLPSCGSGLRTYIHNRLWALRNASPLALHVLRLSARYGSRLSHARVPKDAQSPTVEPVAPPSCLWPKEGRLTALAAARLSNHVIACRINKIGQTITLLVVPLPQALFVLKAVQSMSHGLAILWQAIGPLDSSLILS